MDDEVDIDIMYKNEALSQTVSPEELALVESVLPVLMREMRTTLESTDDA